MPSQAELEDVKDRQLATWSSGDYAKVAWITTPLGDELCEAVAPRPGSTVLDVATGTGHVALAAARRFCAATGVDYVPRLIEVADRRARAEGLDIDFRVGDAESLPFEDSSFDCVLSALGVMFTADHQAAAEELARVCRPGGMIGVLSWTPTGFVGEMLKVVASYMAPPPGVVPPTRWGTEEYVSDLLEGSAAELSFRRGQIAVRFPSPEAFAEFFLQHYGPTRKASEALDAGERDALRRDLADLAARTSHTEAGAASDWEYLIAVARRV